jgi:hypothetical protein
MQNNMIDATAHPVAVQVINQGPGIWGNVATGFITAGAAILAVILTHRYTQRRERQTEEQKRKQERLFIATELIFMLEQYAEDCARVAADNGGKGDGTGTLPERVPMVGYPAPLNFDNVAGDWRSLPATRMYQIRGLPLRQAEAQRAIEYAQEHDNSAEYSAFFGARQYEFALLGIKAINQARLLRKLCGLPAARLNSAEWSAQTVMMKVWKREREALFERIASRLENKQH